MGRMLMILVTGMGILFSMANIGINNSNVSMVNNAVIQYDVAQAKNLASSAVEIAMKNLQSDAAYTGSNNIVMNGGTSKIMVQNTTSQFYKGTDMHLTDAKLVIAIGSAGDVSDTIYAVVQIPVVSTSTDPQASVPAFLDYAVATGNNLTMNGNVNIVDDNNSQWNANAHTNGDFWMNGNNTIKGFLTYHGDAHSNPSQRLDQNIIPNINPNHLANRSKMGDLVTIPSFNPDAYKSIATTVYNNNAILNGNNTLGTKDKPAIVYVGGDLILNGNISGYGAIIVKGNIIMNGNIKINPGSEDPNVSNLALYTRGDFNANGNVEVHAQILTGGNANLNGNSKVYGNVVTRGTINFNGNVTVYYKPANAALTTPFWKPEEDDSQTPGNGIVYPQIYSYYDNLNNKNFSYK